MSLVSLRKLHNSDIIQASDAHVSSPSELYDYDNIFAVIVLTFFEVYPRFSNVNNAHELHSNVMVSIFAIRSFHPSTQKSAQINTVGIH